MIYKYIYLLRHLREVSSRLSTVRYTGLFAPTQTLVSGSNIQFKIKTSNDFSPISRYDDNNVIAALSKTKTLTEAALR